MRLQKIVKIVIWQKQLQYLGITIFRKCENRKSNAAAVGGEENPSYLSQLVFIQDGTRH